MCPLKSKPVLRQAFVIVCLLLGLSVFDPSFARSDVELGPVHPDLVGNPANGGIGKNALASIKIDTVSHFTPGEVVETPILIRNDVEFGKFQLEVDFCYQNLTFYGAERGEALSHISNEEYDWEYFTYRLLPHTPTLYKCLIFGVYDVPNAHQGVPLAPNSDYVSLVVLQFVIHHGFPEETFLPIIFEWETWDCLENTFENPYFDTLYVSQDSLQFNTIDCPPESLEYLFVSPSLEFSDGGIYAFYDPPPIIRGDINYNTIPYEVADLVLFSNYLLYGDSLLIDPEAQSANSDVNWDDFAWSIADFIHLGRVIVNDAPEVVEPTSQSEYLLDTWMTTVHALPNDTVVFPVWYDGEGTESVHGISFKIDYDPDSLTLVGVDFSETSLEDWEAVYTRLENGTVRVNACPEFFTTSLSDSLTSYTGPRQIAKLVFEISDVDTPTFIPVSFSDDTASQVQANAFATIDGALTRLGISSLRNGGIQVGGPIVCTRGDINFNMIPYEAADLVLFHNFLLHGPGVLIYDPEAQTCASDANADYLYWTIADFLYLDRVIHNDAPAIPGKAQEGSPQEHFADEFRLISSSAHPGEVVSVPIWLANSMNAWGTTFKVIFDGSLLSVEGVETAQTPIEGWEEVSPVSNPGELFFFAFPDWDIYHPYPCIGSGKGILIKVNFRVDEGAPSRTFLPITFQTEQDWGHYNAYSDTTGLIFVQPSTLSGWIFTDVISGDANSDGILDLADVVYLINYLYRGDWPPSPLSLGDFNQDDEVNLADVVALINYLFRS